MKRVLLFMASGLLVLQGFCALMGDESPFKGQLNGADAVRVEELEGRLVQRRMAGELAQALAAAKEALALRTRLQGANHWQVVDLRIEVESLERVLGLPPEVRREFATIPRMDGEATRLREQGAYVQAEALERKLLEVRQRVLSENHRDLAMSYNNLGFNLYGQGKFDEAIKFQRLALEGRRKALGEAHPQVAASYGNLAQVLRALGRPGEAQPLFEKALATWLDVMGEDYLETAHAYSNLGFNLYEQGKYQEAEKLFRTALALHLRVRGEDNVETATGYGFLAYALHGAGRHAEAEPLFQKAYQIQRRVRGEAHPETITCLNNLATNFQSQGDFANALPFCRRAYELARGQLGPDNPLTLHAALNLAVTLNNQGKFAEAQDFYDEALVVTRRLYADDHPQTALCHSHVAANLTCLERHAEARPHYEKALAIRRAALGENHLETSRSLNGLANSFRAEGRFAEAQPLYEKSVEVARAALGEAHRDVALGYANLAMNLVFQGKAAEAQPLLDKAVSLITQVSGQAHPETIGCMTRAASNLHLQGRTAEGLAVLQGAGRAYEMARLRISAQGLDRSILVTGEVPFPYEAVFLAILGRGAEAWQPLERGLARGLLDETRDRASRELPAEKRAELNEVNQRYASLRGQILNLVLKKSPTPEEQSSLRALLAERASLENRLGSIAAEQSQSEVLPLATIQAELARCPRETALVAWVDLRNQTGSLHEHWACLVRAQGTPVWVRLPGSGPDGAWTVQDDELPDLVRQGWAKRGSATADDAVARLRRQRLEPLTPHLRGVAHLLVVPVGLMANVPVEALTDEFTVSYVPSGTQFVRLRQTPSRAGQAVSLLGLADPAFSPASGNASVKGSGQRPQPLPGTAREVQAIASLFPSATTLLRSEASEQKLRELASSGALERFQVLHFATHGVSHPTQSFESALILAQDALPDPIQQRLEGNPPVDGRLTAREVIDGWKLHADLVVLSACESALGRKGGGDGLLGFSQAFLLAGARSVLLSLWQVDDVATALLMVRFYENWLGKHVATQFPSQKANQGTAAKSAQGGGLRGKGMTKAEALKEAKHWLRNLQRKEIEECLANLPETARGLKLEHDPASKPRPDDRPFERPYFWSAFILIGNPD